MRVIVAEDDEGVRRLLQLVLSEQGHEVVAESSAERLVARHALQPDLLITDLILPGLSGRELDAALRLHWPELRTLFISGYGYHPLITRLPNGRYWRLLQKPFTPEELDEAIEQLSTAQG
jgi:two-component system, cell cycle sensor histidine kinase and response regulator CckA